MQHLIEKNYSIPSTECWQEGGCWGHTNTQESTYCCVGTSVYEHLCVTCVCMIAHVHVHMHDSIHVHV